MVFAVFDENVAFRAEGKNRRNDRNADRRAARYDADSADRQSADRPAIASMHESVQNVQGTQLAADNRGDRVGGHRTKKPIERNLDDGRRVAGTGDDGVASTPAGLEAIVAPSGRSARNGIDDGTNGQCLNHRLISSWAREATPRGPDARRGKGVSQCLVPGLRGSFSQSSP